MDAYIHRVLLLVWRDSYNLSALLACTVLADFYVTGMTVVLMGFA